MNNGQGVELTSVHYQCLEQERVELRRETGTIRENNHV